MDKSVEDDIVNITGRINISPETIEEAARLFYNTWTYATTIKNSCTYLKIRYSTGRYLYLYFSENLGLPDARDKLVSYKIVKKILGNCIPNEDNYNKAIFILDETISHYGRENARMQYKLKQWFVDQYSVRRQNDLCIYNKSDNVNTPAIIKYNTIYFRHEKYNFIKKIHLTSKELTLLNKNEISTNFYKVKALKKLNRMWYQYGGQSEVSLITGLPLARVGKLIRVAYLNRVIKIQQYPNRPLKPPIIESIKIAFDLYLRTGSLESAGNAIGTTREYVRQLLERGYANRIIRERIWARSYRKERISRAKKSILVIPKIELINEIIELGSWRKVAEKLSLKYGLPKSILKQGLIKYGIDIKYIKETGHKIALYNEYIKLVCNYGHHPTTTELSKDSFGRNWIVKMLRTYGSINSFRYLYNLPIPKASNSLTMEHNKEIIFNCIKESPEPISRDSIRKITGFKQTSVYVYTSSLVNDNKIKVEKKIKLKCFFSVNPSYK